ncbi:MAG: gamma-glutamyltransferase [Myxococcota bacterium]
MTRPSFVVASVMATLLVTGCPKPAPSAAPEPTPAAAEEAPPSAAREMPAGQADGNRLALGTQGAVTSAEAAASEVGLSILQAGGNAIDAAVAVGFALAVTHPSAGNLGGGGFMVVRMADGTTAAFDYREQAPSAATRDMFLGPDGTPTRERLVGAKAAGIPGTVAGLALAHEAFGTLPWKDVVQPAVDLARKGNALDSFHVTDLERGVKRMREAGFDDSAKFYSKPDGSTYVEGDVWVQPVLANTLAAIAEQGPQAFYEGPIAETMAKENAAAGGIWTAADLAAYEARRREPIVFDYAGHEVITMPPPSAGGVGLWQMLKAAEAMGLAEKPWRSLDEVHLYVEIARRTYVDRNMLLADPDFVDLPLSQLMSQGYVKKRLESIDPDRATPSDEVAPGIAPLQRESHQTTHFSVADGAGNAVSNTYTLNLGFGARYVLPSSGVLLNNEMDDFATQPGSANVFGLVQGEANKIEPRKRMLSSMTPTILVKDGELRAVVGSPGGPTITTTVVQIIRAVVDYGLSIDEAVASPRVHHQWQPDMIWAEEALDDEVEAGLKAKGHEIRSRGAMGHANCIEVDPKTRGFRAVADVERDGGKAVAY